jgi:hypothetical protein
MKCHRCTSTSQILDDGPAAGDRGRTMPGVEPTRPGSARLHRRAEDAIAAAGRAVLDPPTTWHGIDLEEFNKDVYEAQEAEKQAALDRELRAIRWAKVQAIASVVAVVISIAALLVSLYAEAVTFAPK